MYAYIDIKTELDTDPLRRGYASMAADQIAESLSTANITVNVDVPALTVRGILYARGSWNAVQILALEPPNGVITHDSALAAAIGVVHEAQRDGGVFVMSDPNINTAVQRDLSALATQGTITLDDKVALLQAAQKNVSRATQIGWPNGVSAADVAYARSL